MTMTVIHCPSHGFQAMHRVSRSIHDAVLIDKIKLARSSMTMVRLYAEDFYMGKVWIEKEEALALNLIPEEDEFKLDLELPEGRRFRIDLCCEACLEEALI